MTISSDDEQIVTNLSDNTKNDVNRRGICGMSVIGVVCLLTTGDLIRVRRGTLPAHPKTCGLSLHFVPGVRLPHAACDTPQQRETVLGPRHHDMALHGHGQPCIVAIGPQRGLEDLEHRGAWGIVHRGDRTGHRRCRHKA